MVNFRFHLVSLVAVFLALALGIGMGATVIDKATVDSLKNRVTAVENDRNNANQRGDALQSQVNRSNDYEDSTRNFITNGKLANTSVLLIAVRGTDTGPLNSTKKLIADAGGQFVGTLWFPSKDAVSDTKTATQMQGDLNANSNDPASLRQSLMSLVAAVTAGATGPESLKPLVSDGFLEWEGGTAGNDITKANFAAARVLISSGAQPAIPNDAIAIPMTKLLAVQPAKRVVAIESGRDATSNTSAQRAIFLDPLRGDNAVKGHISTVDDLELPQGQVATVLALWQLGDGKVGNYGVANSADAPSPSPANAS